MKPPTYKLHVRRSRKDRLYYIRLTARNGEIVLSSEGHKNGGDCIELMDRLASGRIVRG